MGEILIILVIWIAITIISIMSSKNIVINNEILKKNGYSNIVQVKAGTRLEYCSAVKGGDNYLIQFVRTAQRPIMQDVDELAKLMKEMHYHQGIIVCMNTPYNNVSQYAKTNEIEIKTAYDLNRAIIDKRVNEIKQNSTENIRGTNEEVKEFDDENIKLKETEEEPIRDFSNESFWKKTFKRPTRL